MKQYSLIVLGIWFLFWGGCATPGQKFIDIRYQADHEKTQSGTIGLAEFSDRRTNNEQGYIGYRTLMDNSQEVYFVNGLNLSKTLTRMTGRYLEKNGFIVTAVEDWKPGIDRVEKISKDVKQVLSADINRFECRAKKENFTTRMTLDIDLIFYMGMAENNSLKKSPVSLKLERTELDFSLEKLEQFVSQSMEEVIQKALVF
ncbi:MAG: hypothetical protein ABIJ31_16065 [Pseudomonadota bacterium]